MAAFLDTRSLSRIVFIVDFYAANIDNFMEDCAKDFSARVNWEFYEGTSEALNSRFIS